MAEFNREKLTDFIATIYKYMHLRGSMTQRDLAIVTETGVSTMSRFLNQRTTDLNSDLIARIVAKLDIPRYEIIDFVDEDFSEKFLRLVDFYKQEEASQVGGFSERESVSQASRPEGTAKKNVTATISVGGNKVNIPFSSDEMSGDAKAFYEKFNSLSTRQKAFVAEFLNLDMDGRDLIVDLGNNLFRYFKQKGMNF